MTKIKEEFNYEVVDLTKIDSSAPTYVKAHSSYEAARKYMGNDPFIKFKSTAAGILSIYKVAFVNGRLVPISREYSYEPERRVKPR